MKGKFFYKIDYNTDNGKKQHRNSKVGKNVTYEPTYNAELGHCGDTWVGSPFIEVIKDKTDNTYEYKLRFKKK